VCRGNETKILVLSEAISKEIISAMTVLIITIIKTRNP